MEPKQKCIRNPENHYGWNTTTFPETSRAAPSSHTPALTSTGAAANIVPVFVAPTQTPQNAAYVFFSFLPGAEAFVGKGH